MKRKKNIALFLAVVMCMSLIPVNAFAVADDGVLLTKTAEKVADRTYEINLGVEGSNVIHRNPIDITLVIDVSTSMRDNGRLAMTKAAAENFINEVMALNGSTYDPSKDVRVSIVKFGTVANAYAFQKIGNGQGNTGWKDSVDSSKYNYYTNSPSTAVSEINNLSAPNNNGTNTEAGFMAAKAVADSRNRSNAASYVIFMTDGVPTFRISGSSFGSSNSVRGYGTVTSQEDFNEAVAAGKALKNAGNTVYTVGLLTGYSSSDEEYKITCANNLLSDDMSYTRSSWVYEWYGSYYEYGISYSENGSAYSSDYTRITTTDEDAAADQISDAYSSLAGTITSLATGTVTDIVPASFTVDQSSISIPQGASKNVVVNANGTTTITVSGIKATSEGSEITYRVVAKDGYYGSAFTNVSATYDYTLTSGGTGSKTFAKPVVPLAPVANNDAAATSVNQVKTIDVLTNDVNTRLEEGSGSVSNLSITDIVNTNGNATVNVVGGNVQFTSTTAGTYTFTYRASADITINGTTTTVKSSPATVTVTVNAGTIEYTSEGYTGVYDMANHGITVVATDAAIKYGTESGTYNLTSSPEYKNVGTYTVYFEITREGYTTVSGSEQVVISKKAATVETGSASKVYDGSALTNSTVTLGGIIVEDDVTAAATGSQTAVGSSNNTVTIGGVSAGNYDFTNGTTLGTLIVKGTIEYTSEGYTGVYDMANHASR